MKKKLFCYSDFVVPTGFGTVAKELYSNLHTQFDVSVLGINYTGLSRYDSEKYFVYPVDRSDILGLDRFSSALSDAKPDIVFLFQDPFHIAHVLPLVKKYSKTVPIIIYSPIDASPIYEAWRDVYEVPEKAIMYTNWASKVVKESIPDLKLKSPFGVLYHGVSEKYKLLPNDQVTAMRKANGWENKFVLISNNRFQPRKALPLLLRAYALFAKGYKKCSCGNYYLAEKSHCDLNGCDNTHVVEKVMPKSDVMMYLHANMIEPSMGNNTVHSLMTAIMNAGFTTAETKKYLSMYGGENIYREPYTEEDLNLLYNAADLNVSTSTGEGFGLSLIEAMASGTRSLAPRNSAIPEVLGSTGRLVNNSGFFNMAKDNSYMRPVVSITAFVDGLEAEYAMWLFNGKKKIIDPACIERVKTVFQWDDKREQLKGWLEEYV